MFKGMIQSGKNLMKSEKFRMAALTGAGYGAAVLHSDISDDTFLGSMARGTAYGAVGSMVGLAASPMARRQILGNYATMFKSIGSSAGSLSFKARGMARGAAQKMAYNAMGAVGHIGAYLPSQSPLSKISGLRSSAVGKGLMNMSGLGYMMQGRLGYAGVHDVVSPMSHMRKRFMSSAAGDYSTNFAVRKMSGILNR